MKTDITTRKKYSFLEAANLIDNRRSDNRRKKTIIRIDQTIEIEGGLIVCGVVIKTLINALQAVFTYYNFMMTGPGKVTTRILLDHSYVQTEYEENPKR